MDEKCISECQLLIKKYYVLKDDKKKQLIRNQIFEKIYPDIMSWIGSILADKKMFLTKEEMTSISWDCFSSGLKNYKEAVPLPNHFYTYSKYFLMSNAKKYPELLLDDLSKNIHDKPNGIAKENLEESWLETWELKKELLRFREKLPDKYKETFDDALMSMSAWSAQRVRRNTKNYPFYRYDEAKKVFKLVIKFILNKE